MSLPVRKDQTSFKSARFPFSFTFQQESGAAIDVSGYDINLSYFTLVNQDNPEVELTGELEVAGNEVSGQLSGDQTTFFYNKVVYFEMRITSAHYEIVAVTGRHAVANTPNAARGASATVTIPDWWLNYLLGNS